MSMRTWRRSAFLAVLCLWLLQGCASNTAMPVADEFWQNGRPALGVAITTVPRPEVRLRRIYSGEVRVPRMLLRPHDEDRDAEDTTMIEADQRRLERFLRESDLQGLTAARDLFVQRLSDAGFPVVAILQDIDPGQVPNYTPKSNGYALEDYRGIMQAKGLERLIVLQVRWNGVYCHYMRRSNNLTEAAVTVRGEMVDLTTNRLLWRSSTEVGTIRKAVACSCDRPSDKACVLEELNRLFEDAAATLADDFFANAPQ